MPWGHEAGDPDDVSQSPARPNTATKPRETRSKAWDRLSLEWSEGATVPKPGSQTSSL